MKGYLSISEAAQFVGLSRPTFNERRERLKLKALADGNKVLIKKSDLLELYAQEVPCSPHLNMVVLESDRIESLYVDGDTWDLRKLDVIDGYGIVSLVTTAANRLESGESLFFVLSDSWAVRTLQAVGFFNELKRRFGERVYWNQGEKGIAPSHVKAFLPLHYLSYRGQERKLVEELIPLLKKQKFDESTIGYLGWIIGELADNALTHAQGPCYVLIGQFGAENNFFEVSIGDTGKGIHGSLKENPQYKELSDRDAFLKAFESYVSCWNTKEKPRGKGLCDLLTIAMGNESIVRVDSKEMGLMFNFIQGQREALLKSPASEYGGTRYCLLLINGGFKEVKREEVDRFIQRARSQL